MTDSSSNTEPVRITNAGVRFPPPLLFVAGLAIGWLLERFVYPLPIPTNGSGLFWKVGDLLILAGAVIVISGMITFTRARTAIIPHKSASTIVTHGPYRFTRNPMYLGLTLAYLGVTLLLLSHWPLILLPLVLIILFVSVIRKEERYLTDAFGAEYTEYCGRVRRWI